jgi:hypothetical protein
MTKIFESAIENIAIASLNFKEINILPLDLAMGTETNIFFELIQIVS